MEYLAGLMDDANLYDFARSGATSNNVSCEIFIIQHCISLIHLYSKKLILRNTEDMNAQVNRYLRSDASKENKENSLFTMWIGVNDMTVLFSKHPLDTPKRQSIINGIMATIRYDMVNFVEICLRIFNAEMSDLFRKKFILQEQIIFYF